MEVILKKDVPNCGRIGEVVNVKPGFARNFLLPRELAVVANLSNKRSLDHHKRLIEKEKAKVRASSEEAAKEVEKVKISFKKRFNESGRMFGTLTNLDLVQAFKEKGYEFDRRDFSLPEIKGVGSYQIKVRLPGDVMTQVEIKIEALKDPSEKKAASKKKSSKKDEKTKKASQAEATDTSEATEVENSEETSNDTNTVEA